jgi:hypothetical protein
MPKLSWIEMRAISKTRILGTALNIYGSKIRRWSLQPPAIAPWQQLLDGSDASTIDFASTTF